MKTWIWVRKGINLNRHLEERMILVVGSGILLGAVFHHYFIFFKPFVPYVFAYMTFAVSIGSSSRDFINALRQPGLYLIIFTCLHLILPGMATILSKLFLPVNPQLQAGIILGTAIPIGVASTIWVNISKGDTAVSLTSVIADTLVSPFVVPLIILFTVGEAVHFDVAQLIIGLLGMIVVPTIVGVALHDMTQGRIKRKLSFITGPSTKILLALVIATNLGVAWNSLGLLKTAIPIVIALVFWMSCSGYLLGYFSAVFLKKPSSLINTMIFTIGMRNITAGLVMALNYFPETTAIPVVFSIIFQQPLAALCFRFLVQKNIN